MFIHNFKYSLKYLFKDKMLIFWTFVFPIILGTLFSLAFSNIENSEKLDVIDIAIVGEDVVFKSVFDSLSEGDDKLFNLKYTSYEDASMMLGNDEIVGYVDLREDVRVVVGSNGINETVLKYVVDEVLELKDITSNIVGMMDFDAFTQDIYTHVMIKMSEDNNIVDVSSDNVSYTMANQNIHR